MTCVYVIAPEGQSKPCKVGIAINPERRARDLSTGSPVQLRVMGSVQCEDELEARKVEAAFHKLVKAFPPLVLRGEWVQMQAEDCLTILNDRPGLFEALEQLKEAR